MVKSELARELAFKRVPGWWPRAYISLLLFRDFKESNYVAPAYSLRKKCKEYGIGKTTLYKGLNTLINEGLVKKVGGLYMLTDDGKQALLILDMFEREVNRLNDAGGRAITELMRLKRSSFIEHAIHYVEAYIEAIKTFNLL